VTDAPRVIARIKVMAGLDVNERNNPLDGRIKFPLGRNGLDIRVSITPCVTGEKVVMRIVDSSRLGNKLDDVGMIAPPAEPPSEPETPS